MQHSCGTREATIKCRNLDSEVNKIMMFLNLKNNWCHSWLILYRCIIIKSLKSKWNKYKDILRNPSIYDKLCPPIPCLRF